MIFIVLALGGFGLVVLYSAAGGSFKPWAESQGIKFVVFMIMALALSRVREERWKDIAFPGYAIILALLLFVELLGAVSGGSQRWLDLGIIRLQPSELMKLFIVLALARFFDMLPAGEIRRWNAVWLPGVLIGLPAALLLNGQRHHQRPRPRPAHRQRWRPVARCGGNAHVAGQQQRRCG